MFVPCLRNWGNADRRVAGFGRSVIHCRSSLGLGPSADGGRFSDIGGRLSTLASSGALLVLRGA